MGSGLARRKASPGDGERVTVIIIHLRARINMGGRVHKD